MRKLSLALFRGSKDIEDFFQEKVATRDIWARRQAVKMCVIDDDPFKPLVHLRAYGYNITPIGDITKIIDLKEFDIVLCDILGVGLQFNKRMQGASIITEAKRVYPEKLIVAYTAASLAQGVAKEAKGAADDLIKKDIDNEEWVIRLDSYCDIVLDPYKTWQKVRLSLASRGVDTKNILQIEHAYVKSISKKDKNFSELGKLMSSDAIRDDAKSIVNGVVSSAVFEFILK